MAKFCANCGQELISGKPFCPDCGYSSNATPGQHAAPAHHLVQTEQFAMPGQVPEPEYQPRIHHLEAPEPQPQQNSTVPQSTVPQHSNEPSPKQPMIRAQQFIQPQMAQPAQMPPAQMPLAQLSSAQMPSSQLPSTQMPPAQLPSAQLPQNSQAPPYPFASQSQPPALNIQQPATQPPKEQPQKKTGCLDSPLLTVCNVIFAIIMAIELIVASLWYPGFFIKP